MRLSPRLAALLLSVILPAVAAAPALGQAPAKPKTWREQPLTDELVNKAIDDAVNYLLKVQTAEGHWETKPIAEYQKLAKDANAAKGINSLPGVYGGHTALVLMALLKSKVKPEHPKIQAAVKFLQQVQPTQTYGNALRGAIFATLNKNGKYRNEVEAAKKWLLNDIYIDGLAGYNPPASPAAQLKPGGADRDLSNTQYLALGMWLISDSGAEVPDKFWELLQGCYLKLQLKDGSWNYGRADRATEKGYQSMTLGALATLFIIWDKRFTANCETVPPGELRQSIIDGQEWLAKNFDPSANVGKDDRNWFIPYTLYGVERVGVASGLKYFGDRNWWDLSARYLLFTQNAKDGNWAACYSSAPAEISTAWALLFLSYGRAPIVFNKLAYGDEKQKLTHQANAVQWNSRPRSLARLTAWMHTSYEQLFNWQIMPIDRPLEELLDAPVLLLSGRAALSLTDIEKSKLRDYVLSGGLLVGEAVDNSQVFCQSFRKLAAELFGQLEMAKLPADHPIYTAHFKLNEKSTVGGQLPVLEGLSNGVRTMIVLCPRDISCPWQRNEISNSRRLFELGANLMEYASDHGRGLVGRGTSYLIKDRGNKPAKTITVGRLVWGNQFQWDPEPMAWRRLDIALRNANKIGVTTQPCDFKAPVDPKAIPLVHVTGTTGITLTDEQKQNLKKYVADGGVLLSDPAGGLATADLFNESYVKLVGELFGPMSNARPPFLDAATDDGTIELRHIDGLPMAVRKLELNCWKQGDRWAVLHVPYDLTAAIAGFPNVEPVGMTTATAERFMAVLLDWAAKPAVAAVAPEH